MTLKIFSLNDAMNKLRAHQQRVRDLEDQHRYKEAEELFAVEMLMVQNITFHYPDAFNK